MKIPKRGSIIILNLNPTAGREQQGLRPCVVISHTEFNEVLHMCYVAPVTSTVRNNAFEVPIRTKKTTGVALTHQVKVIDLKARTYTVVDTVTTAVLESIVSKVKNIID